MIRYQLLFILSMFSWSSILGQVSISYCPDIKSDDKPSTKIGKEFLANGAATCTGYCASQCQLALLDPIGGYELGYYLYKDKAKDAWGFHWETGTSQEALRQQLLANAEANKHKLQGGKEGLYVTNVPSNDALTKIGNELLAIWEGSKAEFNSYKGQAVLQGELAKVFSTIEMDRTQAVLSLKYLISGRVPESYDAIAQQLFQHFPSYDRQEIDDTTSHYFRNREFPTIRWAAYPSRNLMQLTFQAPDSKEPPRLVFNHDQLRPSKSGTDTLVSIPLRSGKSGYVVAVNDESALASIRFNKQSMEIQVIDSLRYAILEVRPELNLQKLDIEAKDEHGWTVTKTVMLLRHEAEPPKFGLLDTKENTYRNPGDEVVLDKFGQRFELRGKVQDDSPIRSLRINKELVKLDENNLFSFQLKPSDNNQTMTVVVTDAHGNSLTDKFRLKFKESGLDRVMKQKLTEEEFASNNLDYLKKNGQSNLKLWIQDDRFYLQRIPAIDTGSAAEAQFSFPTTEHTADVLVPFGCQALDFNGDFELSVNYKQVEPNSLFFFAFGINDTENSYHFVYGERDNLFLGQMENGIVQCFGEGCPQNAFNRVYSRYSYIAREPVKPNFFEQGTSVPYNLTIKRYNQFYLGALDDPQDYLFVKIDNGIDPPKELRYKLSGGNGRITGSKCGFGLGKQAFIGVDRFTFHKGESKTASAFFEDKETEKFCMPTCYGVDAEKKADFYDCLSDDYHALIIANGNFSGGLNTLDSAVARGTRLRDQLTKNYQFKGENVTFKTNLKKEEFLSLIDTKLPEHLTKKDKLLIYIITHGTSDKHLAFADGQVSSSYLFSVLNENPSNPKYKCKQILVVLDACYSGDMAPTSQQESNSNRLVCDAFAKGSRLLFTSASSNPTKDSELTKAILNRLETHPERFLSIDKLFEQAGDDFSRAMQGTTRPTLTIFEPSANEPNGSYLFVKKKFYQ